MRLSILSEVVVVSVDTAAHLRGLDKATGAHFISLIRWNVQLEEASVSDWERLIAHVGVESDLMPVLEPGQIDWQSIAAPDKLEVRAALLVREALEHAPEALDDVVVGRAVRVARD